MAIAESAKRATISGRAAPDAAVATAGAPARSERSEPCKDGPGKWRRQHRPRGPATPPAPAASAAAPPRIGDMTPGMQRGMANVALLAALRLWQRRGVRNALLRGADVTVRDDRGRAALQIARENNQTEIIRPRQPARASNASDSRCARSLASCTHCINGSLLQMESDRERCKWPCPARGN